MTLLFLYILVTHFLADFIFQTDEMAQKKSSDWFYLRLHVMVYGLITTLGMVGALVFDVFAYYGINLTFYLFLNVVMHYITDACTSRVSKYLWEKNKLHLFFCTIGFDQLIHTATLIYTADWLLRT